MVPPTSRWSAPAAAAVALAAACSAPTDRSGRLLRRAPSEAEVVVAITPAQVAGTWLDATVSELAAGTVPGCVLDAARAAGAVVVAWAAEEGTLIVIDGRRGAPCPELAPLGDDRVWVDGLEPEVGKDGFFADRERRRRWSELDAAPLRAVADLELAAGIVVHARATADPRAGLHARAVVRTDDRPTLLSLRDRYLRWRAGLDRERLGAAWPAIAAIVTAADSADPDQVTDLVEVKLAGEDGEIAAALAVSALTSGLGGAAPRLPCPTMLGDFTGRAACDDGEITLTEELFEELRDDPEALWSGIRTVDATHNGAFAGLRLEALSAQDPLTWLGFANGDIIDAVDGRPLESAQDLSAVTVRLMTAGEVELGVTRRGRHGTLRFRVD